MRSLGSAAPCPFASAAARWCLPCELPLCSVADLLYGFVRCSLDGDGLRRLLLSKPRCGVSVDDADALAAVARMLAFYDTRVRPPIPLHRDGTVQH